MNETKSIGCEATGSMLLENDAKPKNVITRISGIYGLRNRLNNKWYVGQSVNIKSRWKRYKYLMCEGQPKLYRALLKYGHSAFEENIIEPCGPDKLILDDRETYWVKFYNSVDNGYNCTEGGFGSKGHSPSKQTRLKLSTARKGMKFSDEWKKNIGIATSNRIVSEDTKNKMRKSQTGRIQSKETRNKISNTRKGIVFSEDHKRKLKEAAILYYARKKAEIL